MIGEEHFITKKDFQDKKKLNRSINSLILSILRSNGHKSDSIKKLAKSWSNSLTRKYTRIPTKMTVYEDILDFINSEGLKLGYPSNPRNLLFSGIGYEGKYVDRLSELVSERVKIAFENSNYYLEEELIYEQKRIEIISHGRREIIRRLKRLLNNDTQYDVVSNILEDWEFGRKLTDFVIHQKDKTLFPKAEAPKMPTKRKVNLANEVRQIVKKDIDEYLELTQSERIEKVNQILSEKYPSLEINKKTLKRNLVEAELYKLKRGIKKT